MVLVRDRSIALELLAGRLNFITLAGKLLLPAVEVQLVGFERCERFAQPGIERFALGVPCLERLANRESTFSAYDKAKS